MSRPMLWLLLLSVTTSAAGIITYIHFLGIMGDMRQHSASFDAPFKTKTRSTAVPTYTLSNIHHKLIGPSDSWVNSQRLGNTLGRTDEKEISAYKYATSMILHPSPFLSPKQSKMMLEQTICMDTSRFVNWEAHLIEDNGEDAIDENQTLSDLAFRLIYLAVHDFQHRHARDEATARAKCLQSYGCSHQLLQSGVGPFDYSCPDAKFLVSWLGDWGMGASLTRGGVYSMFQGMVSGRVPLLLNSIPEDINIRGKSARYFLKRTWSLASCDRKDLQCFFLPLSPCVITKDELSSAVVLNQTEENTFRITRKLPPKYENERVVIVGNDISRRNRGWRKDMHDSSDLRNVLFHTVWSWLNQSQPIGTATTISNLDEKTIHEALHLTLNDEYIIDDAVLFYILRPNFHWQPKLKEITKKAVPEGFNPNTAIGLPIRSSDKCLKESGCLSFDQYMEVVKGFARKAAAQMSNSTRRQLVPETIVLTSESLPILRGRFDYPRNDNFPFDFVVNSQDVAQGTGYPIEFKAMKLLNVTADDIMFSAVSALRMQLLAASTVGNCCSGFHNMMRAFLSRGCGAARSSKFECLQENENPDFRLCCYMTKAGKSQRCKEMRQNKTKKNFHLLHPDIPAESARFYSKGFARIHKKNATK